MTKRIGRPTKYKPEFDDLAFKFALLGATDAELAMCFQVNEQSIKTWYKRQPGFLASITRGKYAADANVAHALYRRALGDERTPPDTNAASLWLRNRQPAKWRDRIEHSGPGGEALQIQIVRYAEPQPKVIDGEAKVIDSPALIEAAAPAEESVPIYKDSATDAADASNSSASDGSDDGTVAARESHVVEIKRYSGAVRRKAHPPKPAD